MSTIDLIREIELDIGDIEHQITGLRAKITQYREEGTDICLALIPFTESAIESLEGNIARLKVELDRRRAELATAPKVQGKAVVLTLSVKSIGKIQEVAKLNRCTESEALNLILETMD